MLIIVCYVVYKCIMRTNSYIETAVKTTGDNKTIKISRVVYKGVVITFYSKSDPVVWVCSVVYEGVVGVNGRGYVDSTVTSIISYIVFKSVISWIKDTDVIIIVF